MYPKAEIVAVEPSFHDFSLLRINTARSVSQSACSVYVRSASPLSLAPDHLLSDLVLPYNDVKRLPHVTVELGGVWADVEGVEMLSVQETLGFQMNKAVGGGSTSKAKGRGEYSVFFLAIAGLI